MSSEVLDKTVITDNWQFFWLFQHFIHHKKILKVTKFQFKIICCSRVLDKNIPLWFIVPPTPGANRVNKSNFQKNSNNHHTFFPGLDNPMTFTISWQRNSKRLETDMFRWRRKCYEEIIPFLFKRNSEKQYTLQFD